MIKQAIVFMVLLCLTILVGCGIPITSNTTVYPDPTRIYQTISAGLTETSTQFPAPTQTDSPSPTQTIPILDTPQAQTPTLDRLTPDISTTNAVPCNRAAAGKPFIDVTIPDGTRLKPGESFTKTWRLANNGSCAWSSAYGAVWFSGEKFASSKSQNFSGSVLPGESIDISLDLVAPEAAGFHQGNWKLRTGDGALFGLGPEGESPFWVRVEVMDITTPGEVQAETATPTSQVAIHDIVIMSLNSSIDLDIGKINSGSADDLSLSGNASNSYALLPLNGARIAFFGSQPPTETDCVSLPFNSNGIPLSAFSGSPYLCYRTNQGQLGMGKVISVNKDSLSLEFTTWIVP
jgi:hypothetical protein